MTRRIVGALVVALMVGVGLVTPPSVQGAAGTTLYVDGKVGSDANDGRSTAAAFKTISKAAATIPAGSAAGWTVIVKGYTDYVYRERPIPTAFASWGSSSAHITFKATGYVAGTSSPYVKPIVSGADPAPRSGSSWTASSTSGVFWTPWDVSPFWFGTQTGTIKTAIFQDTSTWVWEATSLSDLGSRASKGLGGFWWDKTAKRLYVAAVGSGTSPKSHRYDVPMRPAFYFKGSQGAKYIDVRGFEVRHSGNGIAFDMGADYSTAADNRLVGNFPMGLVSSGAMTAAGTADPAVGNIFGRNQGWANVLELIKIDEGNLSTTVCDNVAHDNGLRGIFVQGPQAGSTYTGQTSSVLICRNVSYDHTYNPTGSVYNNAAGIVVANGAQKVTLDGNTVHDNDVGIHITQEASGPAPMNGLVLKDNVGYVNRRFGLNIYDGSYGTGSGSLTSTGDVYWGNGVGVMVNYGISHKSFAHLTLHDNLGDGMRIGVTGKAASSVTVTTSLFTANASYGFWLVTGNSASLTYSGLSGNTLGGIKGSPYPTTANNSKAAGYQSTSPSSSNYLVIGASSYQYSAGPGGTPIGAWY